VHSRGYDHVRVQLRLKMSQSDFPIKHPLFAVVDVDADEVAGVGVGIVEH